jgi:hypothetical protein
MDEYVIETDDSEEIEPEEATFPWKPIMAAFVAGATSVATVAAVRKHRKKKALDQAEWSEATSVPPTIIQQTPNV